MELAELLDREGLTPDELLPWARERATALVATLVAEPSPDDDQRQLVDQLVARIGSTGSAGTRVEPAITEDSVGVTELPPPPEQSPRIAGEPEPLLETFDTRPIALGTHEAAQLLDETSTPMPTGRDDDTRVEPVAARSHPDAVTRIERIPSEPEAEPEPAATDESLEEIELDELVEIDDEELEMLEDEDDPSDERGDESDAPVRSGDTASGLPIVDLADPADPADPVQTGHTASFPTVPLDDPTEPPVQTGHTAAHPVIPVQTGGTAKHATISELIADEPEDVDLDAPASANADSDEDFELDFD